MTEKKEYAIVVITMTTGKPRALKAVHLVYDDGTVLAVPENSALRIGTSFMKLIENEKFEWRVIRVEKESWFEKFFSFFTI